MAGAKAKLLKADWTLARICFAFSIWHLVYEQIAKLGLPIQTLFLSNRNIPNF